MKQIISTFLIITGFILSYAQSSKSIFTYENFEEQIIAYEPKKKNLEEEAFNFAVMVLNNTKEATKRNPANFNCIDYYNICMAFMKLEESKEAISIAFRKAISEKNNNICFYLERYGSSGLEKVIPETYYEFYNKCSLENNYKTSINIENYAEDLNLNYNLVRMMHDILKRDTKYREQKFKYYEDPILLEKQNKLDVVNQRVIDSLYNQHKRYLGTSLVGKEYNYVMWLVIQHSNIEMMETYLPIITEAVKNKELNEGPLKALIDRVYAVKYGYQIFGSQLSSNIKIANEAERNKIKLEYGIE